MLDENKLEQQKNEPAAPVSAEKKVPLSWVILGIAAVIIMWALSSWWFR